ncbi:MAG: hypothetical protein IT350_07955 [Deltaproteobacteria bacterium]|nr:hypothetical protein [Deltaproteobacteria bacterium]
MNAALSILMLAIGATGVLAYAVVLVWILHDLYRRWRMPTTGDGDIDRRFQRIEQNLNDVISRISSAEQAAAKSASLFRVNDVERQIRECVTANFGTETAIRGLKERLRSLEQRSPGSLAAGAMVRESDVAHEQPPIDFDALFGELRVRMKEVWDSQREQLKKAAGGEDAFKIFNDRIRMNLALSDVRKSIESWAAIFVGLAGDHRQRSVCIPRPSGHGSEIVEWYDRHPPSGNADIYVNELVSLSEVERGPDGRWKVTNKGVVNVH